MAGGCDCTPTFRTIGTGLLRLLGCRHEKAEVARALRTWRALDFEEAAAAAGLCATALRDFEAWDAHPQGQAVPLLPLVSIERIGDAPPEPLRPAQRPLSGVRVLDLTRVIAGPVCGRTLAAHGADVLLVTSPNLPACWWPIRGGASCRPISTSSRRRGARRSRSLLRRADVFVQGYRPGGMRSLGFGPDQAARIRPGIIYASLSAYGAEGPWAGRRGFDSLVQTASGFNAAEAEAAGAGEPKPLPAQALDHASGYLLAFGVLTALLRRVNEGGSWQVRVSLARTGHWLRGLGRLPQGFDCPELERNRATGFAGGDRLPIRSPCRDPSCRAPGRHTAPLATSFGTPRDGSAPLAGISSGQRLDISARPASRAMCRRSGPV